MSGQRLRFAAAASPVSRPHISDLRGTVTVVVPDDGSLAPAPPQAVYEAIEFQLRVALPRDEALRWVRRVVDDAIGTPGGVLAGPGGTVLDVRAHEVRVRDVRVPLTPREFELLRFLLERQDEVLTADEIAQGVWGHETFGSRNFVESQVSRVRAKLVRAGVRRDAIETLRSVGYILRSDTGPRRDATGYPPIPSRTISA